MNQFAFKMRWVALSFAALTLFVAYMFVSSQTAYVAPDETGAISDTPPAVAQSSDAGAAAAPEQTNEVQFADDQSLIDQATGVDPTPGEHGGDESSDGYGDSNGGGSGDSIVSSQPPQYTPDGTPIVAGNDS
jgi:hypothetical protein